MRTRLADYGMILIFVASMLFVGVMESCATVHQPVTANLSPTGLADYNKTRVIQVLDIIRDAAIDGEKVGAFSHADTVNIVTFHKSTVQVIAATATSWKAAVQTALDALLTHLTPAGRAKVSPYVPLVTAILEEV